MDPNSTDELTDYIANLSDDDALNNFFSQMPSDIICKFERMNDNLAGVCQNDNLWKQKVKTAFPAQFQQKPQDTSWREYYTSLAGEK
jgi:hypothetical protein